MARLNITLDQGEVLQLLGDSGGDAFRALLQESVNAVLRAESDEQLRAGRYEWLPRAMSQETRFLRSRAPTCRNIYGFCVPLRRKRACPVARYTVFAFLLGIGAPVDNPRRRAAGLPRVSRNVLTWGFAESRVFRGHEARREGCLLGTRGGEFPRRSTQKPCFL